MPTGRHKWRWGLGSLLAALLAAAGQAESPFEVTATLDPADAQAFILEVTIPARHLLYADSFQVETGEGALLEATAPLPSHLKDDPFSGEQRAVYDQSFTAQYRVPAGAASPGQIKVRFQGCDDAVCFFPEERALRLEGIARAAPAAALPQPNDAARDWRAAANQFEVAAASVGYQDTQEFIAFLDQGLGTAAPDAPSTLQREFSHDPLGFYRRFGIGFTVLLILAGGLLLNLTPCVLPMIPINLAIIGAGARATSRARGFALGATYGLAIALVYGLVGLVAVFTGATFGSLNASPWFNALIAAIFLLLALAMFDVFQIDFSRLQTGIQRPGAATASTGAARSFGLALFMGAIAALLAGACVAPVVLSVLLLAGKLYAQGITGSLLLPFVLGVGMALPWPFAGAGLSFLPKPGGWMVWVKKAFGLFILIMAGYYALTAWQAARGPQSRSGVEAPGLFRQVDLAAGTDALAASLQEAFTRRQPVLLDFEASWCKNCHAMDRSTLRDEQVVARLQGLAPIKVRADHPDTQPAQDVLAHFQVRGYPTYLLLHPRK